MPQIREHPAMEAIMTDLRQGMSESTYQILDYVDTLPAWPCGALEQAKKLILNAKRTSSPANARVYAQQAAAILIRWTEQQEPARASTEAPKPAQPKRKLEGRRRAQLLALQADGAICRESAVAVALLPGQYYPATLSRMASEGLVQHAYGRGRQDSKRPLSRYWLTAEGLELARAIETGSRKG